LVYSQAANPAAADTLLQNGKIYTVNDRQPRAEAIAIKGDGIVFVGSNDEAKNPAAPSRTRWT
jgi:hypothetical protein